jgi:hypothetical protein
LKVELLHAFLREGHGEEEVIQGGNPWVEISFFGELTFAGKSNDGAVFSPRIVALQIIIQIGIIFLDSEENIASRGWPVATFVEVDDACDAKVDPLIEPAHVFAQMGEELAVTGWERLSREFLEVTDLLLAGALDLPGVVRLIPLDEGNEFLEHGSLVPHLFKDMDAHRIASRGARSGRSDTRGPYLHRGTDA